MSETELLLTIQVAVFTVMADMIAVLCRAIVCLVSAHAAAAADGGI